LLFYFTSYVLNMFRTLIYPSSGACDYSVELTHWSYCSWFDVCWSFGVVGLEWSTTQIPLQPNHTENPTHTSNQEQYDQCVSDRTKSTCEMANYVNLRKVISFKSIRNVQFYGLLQVNGLYLKDDWMDCSSSSNYI